MRLKDAIASLQLGRKKKPELRTLCTIWSEQADDGPLAVPLPEYPRPQMTRQGWINLNGPWDYAINDSRRFPQKFDGEILVPFSPETELSGVNRSPKRGEYLWYRRQLDLPESFSGKRLLLHFGAVDQIATVWVNAQQVTTHVGGYLPFEIDVTDAVEDGSMTLSVVLHLGTLIAVIIAFHKRIWGMIKEFFLSIRDIFKGQFSWQNMNDDRRMMIMVIIATLILVPFVAI